MLHQARNKLRTFHATSNAVAAPTLRVLPLYRSLCRLCDVSLLGVKTPLVLNRFLYHPFVTVTVYEHFLLSTCWWTRHPMSCCSDRNIGRIKLRLKRCFKIATED